MTPHNLIKMTSRRNSPRFPRKCSVEEWELSLLPLDSGAGQSSMGYVECGGSGRDSGGRPDSTMGSRRDRER